MNKLMIGAASWTVGQRFLLAGTEYEVDSFLHDGRVQIRSAFTGVISAHNLTELESSLAANELKFVGGHSAAAPANLNKEIAGYSDTEWAEGIRKLKYVTAALNASGTEDVLRPRLESIHKSIEDELDVPPPSTFLRWRRAYLTGGRSVLALLPRRHRCGRHQKHWPDRVRELVQQAINEKYLKPEQSDIEQTIIYAQGLVRDENQKNPRCALLPTPSESFVRKLIRDIPVATKIEKRQGKFAARSALRQVTGAAKHGESAIEAVLDRVEIDETPLDVMLVDDDTGVLLGRPHITTCVDSYSRCILGYHLSFQQPNYACAAQCLKMVMLPKSKLFKAYPDVRQSFFPYGIPTAIIMDNTFFYHGTDLEKALASVPGILDVVYARSKAGEDKPNVEGVQGQLNAELTKGVPGRTFSNVESRGDYDPAAEALVPLATFRRWLFKWVVDVFHPRPGQHTASPAERWAQSAVGKIITMPSDPEVFDILMGSSDSVRLDHNGIVLEGIRYHSDQFRDIRRRHGESLKVEIRFNEFDLGTIHVLRPDDNAAIVARARDFEYASGRSLHVHRAVRERTRASGREDQFPGWKQSLFEIMKEIEEIRTRGRGRKGRPNISVRESQKHARFMEGNSAAATPPSNDQMAEHTADVESPIGSSDSDSSSLAGNLYGRHTVELEIHDES